MPGPCIVVGVDGSAAGREALLWTVALAEAVGADVVAVHAVGLLEDAEAHDAPGEQHLARRRDEVAAAWCAPLTTSAVRHRIELDDGPAVGVLLRVARREGADLLVVGSRGTGPDPARALGSTSLHVLESPELPVLVVPASAPGGSRVAAGAPLRRVLVAVDRSAASLAALDLAGDVVAALGGSITAVEVVEEVSPFPLGPETTVSAAGEEEAVDRVHALLETAVRSPERRALPVDVVVRPGEAARVLVEMADDLDADLVVTGTRGRNPRQGLTLGSVARTVAHSLHRPTLVVPAAAGRVTLRGPGPA